MLSKILYSATMIFAPRVKCNFDYDTVQCQESGAMCVNAYMLIPASFFSTFHIVIYGEDEDLKNEASYFIIMTNKYCN